MIGYAREYNVEVKHCHIHLITKEIVNSFNPNFVIIDSITKFQYFEKTDLMIDIFNKYPFFSLEHDYNKVSRYRHLFEPGDTYLNGEDEWCMFYKNFWQHKNRLITFYMSQGQKDLQYEKIKEAGLSLHGNSTALMSSCIYSREDLQFIDKLYNKSKSRIKEDYYCIFNTNNPLKGTPESIEYANANNLKYKLFSNMSPKQLLVLFSKSKGLIFMPTMHDVCPRITVESLLLGGEVYTNDYAQHHEEKWFTSGREFCRSYVEERPHYFWKTILSAS